MKSPQKRRLFSAALLAIVAFSAAPARAQAPEVDPAEAPTVTPRVRLRHSLAIDLSATAALGGGVVALALLSDDLTPGTCRFCDGSAPGDVNAVDDFFRDALRRDDPHPAQVMSDVFAFGVAPATAVGFTSVAAAADDRLDEAPLDTLLIAEATLAAMLADEALKPLFARERPYVHALEGDDEQAAIAQGGALLSFPSGHTTAVFAMAASAGTVATMRGYRLAPLVWLAGAMVGAGTAYARMAADKHYFTDVVAGAALGAGIGIAVPLLFHRPEGRADRPEGRSGEGTAVARLLRGARVATSPVPGGRTVSLSWIF